MGIIVYLWSLYFSLIEPILKANHSQVRVTNGIGSVRPNYTLGRSLALILKKYFNEHDEYFTLNCKEVYRFEWVWWKMVQEGREYVHLLLIECWADYDLNKKKYLLFTWFLLYFGNIHCSWEKTQEAREKSTFSPLVHLRTHPLITLIGHSSHFGWFRTFIIPRPYYDSSHWNYFRKSSMKEVLQ